MDDDQLYRMIERDIELLLDDSNEITEDVLNMVQPDVIDSSNSVFQPNYECKDNTSYNCYTNSKSAAEEALLFGQYGPWSTVESDELIPNQLFLPLIHDLNNFVAAILNVYYILDSQMMKKKTYCAFCKKNGMNFLIYTSHDLVVNGIKTCPYLLNCQCLKCFQYGHTFKYCSLNKPPIPDHGPLKNDPTSDDETTQKPTKRKNKTKRN